MRTAIFFGLIAIADAINKDWLTPNSNAAMTLSVLVIMFFVMDVTEFLKKITKK